MTSLDAQVNRVLNEVFAARNFRRLDEFMANHTDRAPKSLR